MSTQTRVGPFDSDMMARAYVAGLKYAASPDLYDFYIWQESDGYYAYFMSRNDQVCGEPSTIIPNFAIED